MTPTTLRTRSDQRGELASQADGESLFELSALHPTSLKMAIGQDPSAVVTADPSDPRLLHISSSSNVTTQLVTLDELRCTHGGVDTDLPAQRRRFALLVYLGMER